VEHAEKSLHLPGHSRTFAGRFSKAKFRNGQFTAQRHLRSSLLAALFVAAAFVIQCLVGHLEHNELPFMLFLASALLAAWYAGWIAALLALIMGFLLASHFFPEPSGFLRAFINDSTMDAVRYFFIGAIAIGLIEVMHRNRLHVEEAKAILEAHSMHLEKQVEARTIELRGTVQFQEELLYHIGHNLRGPLRALRGYSSVLAEEHGSKLDVEVQSYLREMDAAAGRMDKLIDGVVSYGEVAHADPELRAVNVDEAVQGAVALLKNKIEATGAELVVRLEPVAVRADKWMLVLVLKALIENGITFTAPGLIPKVQIVSARRGKAIRLEVMDDGVGIEEKYHARVFAPFEQLSAENAKTGAGMGLAIARQALKRMGGQIGLTSQPGAGSTFWIELPVAA
jgi:signal transduction histidine kinase